VGDVHLSRRRYISSGQCSHLLSVGTAGDVDASSKFWICDTTLDILKFNEVKIFLFEEKKKAKEN